MRGALDIRLLGEPLVLLDGHALALPPSKKTRALLAYLALTGRSHRREKLCALLWDVTDDPRAALRWSLTKLRELVDSPERIRLVANRESVQLDLRDVRVDALEVKQLLRGEVEALPTATLETALQSFRGELLEGLELPEFHAYHAFCVAERDELRRLHERALSTLLEREHERPERALVLARQLLELEPADSALRARFMELLQLSGRAHEAEQEARTSRRLLGAAQVASPGEQSRESQLPRPQRAARDAPLIGRERELARIGATLARARSRLSVVLIEAEAGVGKTRLLRAACAQLEPARVLRATASELAPGSPYGPWLSLLQRALAFSDDARVRALLDELTGASAAAAPDELRARLFQGVGEYVARTHTRDLPLAIVLDDVHWLDEGSCALLRQVLEANAGRPLALLLAARPGALAENTEMLRVLRPLRRRGLLEEIALAPLDARETRELLASVESSADPERVYEECAGNPLFALELARAPDLPERGVPRSIARVVRDRMATLPAEVVDVLRWAALLGTKFELAQLERLLLLDAESFVAALEQLERHGWLSCDAADAAFSHQIVCSAIYDGLSGPRRALMHLKVARLLEQDFETDGARAALLARHAALGGDRATAARACAAAARRCLRLGARADAQLLARMGLPHADALHEPERTTLSIELLDVSFVSHRPKPASELEARLDELSARALELGAIDHARRAMFLRVMATWEDGHSADAQRFAREVERISRLGGPREQVGGFGDAARCLLSLERDLPEAEALLIEAEALAEKSAIEMASVTLARGALSMYRGEYQEADATFTRAAALARRDGDRLAEMHAIEARIEVCLERADYANMERLSAELLTLAERSRAGSEVPYARAALELSRVGGDPQRDMAALAEALVQLDLADAKRRSAVLYGHAAELASARGLAVLARESAERAAQLAEQLNRASDAALARATLLELSTRGPDRQLEQERARALLEVLSRPLSAHAKARARAALAQAHAPKAEEAKSHGTRHRRTRLR